MAERFSCAAASTARAEPRFGTASQVRRWILVEQPGPWGGDAVVESRLPADIAGALLLRAREARARLLLIRRHGRSDAPVGRTCFVAVTTSRVRRVEQVRIGAPDELLDIDLRPLAALEPVGGDLVDDPLFLVCTNGRHDPCCAERGRPLAKALSAAFGPQVWESSHYGGDRFAGNLVCLPHGLYYGHVGAADGPRLAMLYARGEVDLEHFRGRSCHPFPVQAAEYFVRADQGLTGIDDLAVRSVERQGEERFRVHFETPGGIRAITVERVPGSAEQRLTCKAPAAEYPPRYQPAPET